MTAEEIVYCPKHPDREGTLRCIRCGRPMCALCARPSSTGYICPECIRQHEDRFYATESLDYPKTFGVCLLGNLVACTLMLLLNVWWIGVFVGGAAGGAAAGAARRLTPGRVGRHSARVAIAGAVVGAMLAPVLFFLLRFGVLTFDVGLFLRLFGLTLIVCTAGFAVAAYTTYQRRI